METAELGVQTLLQTVVESKDFFLSDRERYFSAIETVLSSFVDFEAVAGVVMSRYASEATDQQTERFAGILRTTLTRFYGASLVSYNGEELVFCRQVTLTPIRERIPLSEWSCRVIRL